MWRKFIALWYYWLLLLVFFFSSFFFYRKKRKKKRLMIQSINIDSISRISNQDTFSHYYKITTHEWVRYELTNGQHKLRAQEKKMHWKNQNHSTYERKKRRRHEPVKLQWQIIFYARIAWGLYLIQIKLAIRQDSFHHSKTNTFSDGNAVEQT